MNNEIELSPYGNMLIYKKGYSPDFVKDAIDKNNLEGLRIFDHLDRLDSLDFLIQFDFLEGLDIDCIYDHDYSFLLNFLNLKTLGIGLSTTAKNTIDLSNQKNLTKLSIQWRKGKILGIEKLEKLTSLCLVDFKENDLIKISSLISLTDIRIKTSSIESLNGIENLVNLQNLYIGNCKKLQSIKAINHLPNLKELYLDTCQNINNYEEVTDLPNLEALSLTDCGKVQSLKFIERYPALQKLSLLGNTVIVDGDLVPAKRIKSVEHKHYSHYNVKVENPSYNQNVKNNLEKIKNWFK